MVPDLDHHIRLDAEERRPPEAKVGELADLHRADMRRHAMRDRRIDRVLGDIALGPDVVVVAPLLGQHAALALHLVRGLPGADGHLADAAHRLAVGGDDAEDAEVVQDVLGGDRLTLDAALGERHVLGDVRVEVVADHEHVEMLVQCSGPQL